MSAEADGPGALLWPLSASAELRTRLLRAVGWSLGALTLAGTALRAWAAPLHPHILALAALLSLTLLLLPFFGNQRRWTPRLGRVLTFVFMLLIAGTGYLAGGLKAPVVVLLTVVPLIGIVLVGRRFGMLTAMIAIGMLVALVLLHRAGAVPETQLAADDVLAMRALMFSIALLVVTAAVWVYDQHSQRLVMQFQREALTDVLTGLHNRRHLELSYPYLVDAAGRRSRPLWLALADVDHFKSINDDHGHEAGDAALRRVAGALVEHCPRSAADLVARLAGDEFVVISAGDRRDVQASLESVQAAVAVRTPQQGPPLSISVGLASVQPGEGLLDVLARADRSLYEAKRRGRRRIVERQHEAAAAESGAGP